MPLHDMLLPLTFPVPATQLMAPPALVQVMSGPLTQYCLLLIVAQVVPSEFVGDASDRSGEFTEVVDEGCVDVGTGVTVASGVAVVDPVEDVLLVAAGTVVDSKPEEQPRGTDIATRINPMERTLDICESFL